LKISTYYVKEDTVDTEDWAKVALGICHSHAT